MALFGLLELYPASFRGVGFYVENYRRSGGRRDAVHEYPQRDDASAEDLGRKRRDHRLRAYVYGDGYAAQRDALLSACEDSFGAGTLVHPWLGTRTVFCTDVTVTEDISKQGFATFDLAFVDTTSPPSPVAATSTAGALLAGVVSLLPVIASAYGLAAAIAKNPALLGGLAEGLLAQAGTSLLSSLTGLSASTIAGLTAAISLISSAPDDTVATPSNIQAALGDVVDAIVAAAPAAAVDDPVTGVVPAVAVTDPSYGLLTFASWGSTLAAPVGGLQQADQAGVQAAVIALVQGSAVAALAQVYAQTDFAYAQQATAARSSLFDLIDGQATAAADAGQDALYLAWRGLAQLAMNDLTQRAQSLPSLGSYATPASLPAVALAQLLYQDATQADALVALNSAIHPLFMPSTGLMLVAA